jgi:hypothetical protein
LPPEFHPKESIASIKLLRTCQAYACLDEHVVLN